MRWFAVLFLAALCGCSTVQSRIRERHEVFEKLSARDQGLVTKGEVREGMTKDAVYIAWGKPDEVMEGSKEKRPFELWRYYIATQQLRPRYTYAPRFFGRHIAYDTFYDPYYTTDWY